MNLDALQQKLLAAGRAIPPSDVVPYAFEKRVMASIAARPAVDAWSVWNRVLWRAAAPCLGVTLLLVAWTFVSPPTNGNPRAALDDELESALLAPLDNIGETW